MERQGKVGIEDVERVPLVCMLLMEPIEGICFSSSLRFQTVLDLRNQDWMAVSFWGLQLTLGACEGC